MAGRTANSRSWTHAPWIVAMGILGCNAVLGLDARTVGSPNDGGDDGAADVTVSSDGSSGSIGPSEDGSSSGPSSSGAAADGNASSSGSGGSSGSSSGAAKTCSTNCEATGLVCERIDGPACEDPDWAEWPISSPPSNGADAGVVESYIDNTDGTVTDTVTGLMWQQEPPSDVSGTTYTQSDGIAYCKGLSLAGYDDWRLPSQPELISLVDYGTTTPSIDTRFFPKASAFAFWSSTPAVGNGALAWGVTFFYGNGGTNAVATDNDVRCVR